MSVKRIYFHEWRIPPTSFPGSLFSASLGRWKKDPGCCWSRYHPESGWQKNLLGGRDGRVFCLACVTKFVGFKSSSRREKLLPLSGLKSNLPMKNAVRFLPSTKYRRLSFTKKFGSRMYTCQLSRIMRESHACRSKIVTSRIQTNFSRLTDNSECNCLKPE